MSEQQKYPNINEQGLMNDIGKALENNTLNMAKKYKTVATLCMLNDIESFVKKVSEKLDKRLGNFQWPHPKPISNEEMMDSIQTPDDITLELNKFLKKPKIRKAQKQNDSKRRNSSRKTK